MWLRLMSFVALLSSTVVASAQSYNQFPPTFAEVRRLGDQRWHSKRQLRQAAISPDGKIVAFGGDWQVGTWNAATGEPVHNYEVSGIGHFNSIAWSPDGTLYAAGQSAGIFRWNTTTHELLESYSKHTKIARRVSLSADGSRLASVAVDNLVVVWKMPAGEVLRTFSIALDDRSSPHVDAVALSPDGKTLVLPSTRKKAFDLFDVDTGARRDVEYADPGYAMESLFTPDGKLFLIRHSSKLTAYETSTGRPVHHVARDLKQSFNAMAVSPDGKLLALVGQNIELSNLETGKIVREMQGRGSSLSGVVFSRDGRTLYAGGFEHAIHRWDVATGKPFDDKTGHTGSVEAVVWPTPDRYLTAGNDRSIRHWNAATGAFVKAVTIPGPFLPRRFTPDGRWLLARSDNNLHIIDTDTGASTTIAARTDWDQQPAISPDGKWVVYATADHQRSRHEIRLIATDGKSEPIMLPGPNRKANALTFSRDGRRLAVGFDQNYTETDPPPVAANAAITFGGTRMRPRKYEREPTVIVFDVAARRPSVEFGHDRQGVCQVEFSPSGRYLALGENYNALVVWDFERGIFLPGRGEDHSSLTQLAFSPDERRIAALARMTGYGFCVYETETLTRIARPRGHDGQSIAGAFSPDGKQIVSGGADALAIVWDATTLRPGGPSSGMSVGPKTPAEAWTQLGDLAAERSEPAFWSLAATGDTGVGFLKSKLQPVSPVNLDEVVVWLKELDDSTFAVRDAANRKLAERAFVVEAELRKQFAMATSAEVKKRLDVLIRSLAANPERLRALRSLHVLETIGTRDAASVLETLAGGEPRDRFTRLARESLERLKLRVSTRAE